MSIQIYAVRLEGRGGISSGLTSVTKVTKSKKDTIIPAICTGFRKFIRALIKEILKTPGKISDVGNEVEKSKEEKNQLVFSYLTLRNLIGFSGILLPLLLAVAPQSPTGYFLGLQPTISDYYYTDRGDVLVVALSVLGVFLITYKGYNRIERVLTFLAGICCTGIAFVPTRAGCQDCAFSVHTNSGGLFGVLVGTGWHFVLSTAFFLSLAVMSLVFFTRGGDQSPLQPQDGRRSQKAKRNIVYKVCGWIIIASIGLMGLYFLIRPDLDGFPFIFILQSVAVFAFGISWLTKGQTLWPDAL